VFLRPPGLLWLASYPGSAPNHSCRRSSVLTGQGLSISDPLKSYGRSTEWGKMGTDNQMLGITPIRALFEGAPVDYGLGKPGTCPHPFARISGLLFPQTGGTGAFSYPTNGAPSVDECPGYGLPGKPKEGLGRFGNRTQVIDLLLERWCESDH